MCLIASKESNFYAASVNKTLVSVLQLFFIMPLNSARQHRYAELASLTKKKSLLQRGSGLRTAAQSLLLQIVQNCLGLHFH